MINSLKPNITTITPGIEPTKRSGELGPFTIHLPFRYLLYYEINTGASLPLRRKWFNERIASTETTAKELIIKRGRKWVGDVKGWVEGELVG